MEAGRVEGIFVTPEHGVLPAPLERVRAHAGRGLEGNRYLFEQAGPGKALTLIAAEALERLEAESGIVLSAAASRRNVLTRGIDVNALVGRSFRIGEVECVGVELCEPCSYLESLTVPGVLTGLVHQAGLYADILDDGEIAVGDPVAVID